MSEYKELHRPQFHFTARENWLNDPNGLVFYNGLWHLFFQHNIEAPTWGKMWWGHAVSEDLLQWRQQKNALYPDEMGSMFSGSAVVDHHNTAGFGAGALLLFYTAAGMHAEPKAPFKQCLAFSQDGGQHWHKYNENPILDWIEAENRDPKVIWHERSGHWIMALYLDADRFCLLRSKNAKKWAPFQEITLTGDSECPDFFPLRDQDGHERWILAGGSGVYCVGRFDGQVFTPETEMMNFELGRNGYAAQSWSNAPNGRCVQISWMAGGRYPEMPFNQQMSIPVELTLVGSGTDVSLARWPVEELLSLRERSHVIETTTLDAEAPLIAPTKSKLFDLSFTVHKQAAPSLYMVVRGHPLWFDWVTGRLHIEPSGTHKVITDRPFIQLPNTPSLSVRLIIDKTSIEVFIDGGKLSASFCFLPDGYVYPLILHSYSGPQIIENFVVHEMRSIWP